MTNSAPIITGFDTEMPVEAMTLVSTSSTGQEGNNDSSWNGPFSPDGTEVLFFTLASNLVAGDTNGTLDVFLKNLVTGTITLVSSSATGIVGNGESALGVTPYSMSGDSVVFASTATNFVAGDTNGTGDVFVKNLTSGAITLVSSSTAGIEGNNSSVAPTMSPDGSKVAFMSLASNLVPGDAGGHYDVFVKDLATGATTLVSTSATGVQGNNDSLSPIFSPDGTKVAFDSYASNLMPGDINGKEDIFIKDLVTGALTLVTTFASDQAYSGGFDPVFSPDGTKVAFYGITGTDTGGDTLSFQIYVKDLVTGTTTLVSASAAGAVGNDVSANPVFSPDGTKIAFWSRSSNLTPGDTNFREDVFVKDLTTGTISLVSAPIQGGLGDDTSAQPFFSPDGSSISFTSGASNLVPGDTNNKDDIFVASLGYAENHAPQAIAAGLTLSDADNTSLVGASVAITSNFLVGDKLGFVNQHGISGSYDGATGVLTLTGAASIAAYQTALESVTFASSSDNPDDYGSKTTRSVSWTVDDGQATNHFSAPVTTLFHIGSVDDAPVLLAPAGTTAARTGLPIAIDHTIALSDPDSTTLASATVSVVANYHAGEDVLAFANTNAATYGNIQGSFNAASGTLTLSSAGDTATVAQFEAALQAVTYRDTAATPNVAPRTIGFTANDGSLGSTTVYKTVSVTADQPPHLATSSGTTAATEQVSVIVDSGLTVSDADNTTLVSAQVSVSGHYQAGQDVLGFENTSASAYGNIAGTFDAMTSILTLTSADDTATVAQFQAALRAVTYTDISDTPSTSSRTVSFAVNDGVFSSTVGTKAVSIAAVNDAPHIVTSTSLTSASAQTAIAVDNSLTVSDADNATLSSARVAISGHYLAGEDVLSFTNTSDATYGNIVATFNAATGMLSLASAGHTATVAQFQAALQDVTYVDTSASPDTAHRTVSFSVNDGSVDSSVAGKTIVVLPVGNAPTLIDLSNGTVSENAANGTVIGTLTDIDPNASDTATYTLLNNDGGRFAIGGTHGDQLIVADSLGLDFEHSSNYAVSVRVTDSTGLFHDQVFGITLSNVDPENVLGDARNNVIDGGALTDTLDGGTGADTLAGGNGDDTYFVGGRSSLVFEAVNQGVDTIYTASSYTLQHGQFVEFLEASSPAGLSPISLGGNETTQRLIGNDGDNLLVGGGGGDTMVGHAGNDTYFVSDATDWILEIAGQGSDTVFSLVSYHLTPEASVELLATSSRLGTDAINLTGNELSQRIDGNYGDNVLNGYGGGDTMYGFQGNDTFYVSSAVDKAFEATGQGTDTVFASVSYTLQTGQSIEYLATTFRIGTDAISLIGNEQDQRIDGNYGANSLYGGDGNDTLYGFDGNDKLGGGNGRDLMDGGNGNDTFIYSAVIQSTGVNRDLIQNFNFAQDKIDLPAIPTGTDTKVIVGTLSDATFDADLTHAIGAAQLAAHHAVLFDPSAGGDNLTGHMFLIVDVNGVAGYQAGADYVIELQSATGRLTLGDFT